MNKLTTCLPLTKVLMDKLECHLLHEKTPVPTGKWKWCETLGRNVPEMILVCYKCKGDK